MNSKLTRIAEIATIIAVLVAVAALVQDHIFGTEDSATAPPSATVAPSSPNPAPSASPGGGSETVSQGEAGTGGTRLKEQIDEVTANVHSFGTGWTTGGLVLVALAFFLILYGPILRSAGRSDSTGGTLVAGIGLPAVWIWVFWPSLSGLGVALFALSCVPVLVVAVALGVAVA